MLSQGLRDALRDFRRQSNGQLSEEINARNRATGELEAALGRVNERDKAVSAANAEVAQLQEELQVPLFYSFLNHSVGGNAVTVEVLIR